MSTEELICRGYELAKRLGLQITAHIAGGTFSLEKGFLKYLRETGRTDVRYLMQLGILDPHWILIHGIHDTELDIEHMAQCRRAFRLHADQRIDPRRRHRPGRERAARRHQRRARHRRTDGRLFGRHGRADEGLHADAACAPSRSDPHVGRTRDRNGDDQCRQGARASSTRSARWRPGKRADIAVFDLEQALCGRAAPADVDLRLAPARAAMRAW